MKPIAPDDASFRLFLSRYIYRGPIGNSKIQINDDFITYVTEIQKHTNFHHWSFWLLSHRTFPINGSKQITTMVFIPLVQDLFRKKQHKLCNPIALLSNSNPVHRNPVVSKKLPAAWIQI